jgi:hypothetical protein
VASAMPAPPPAMAARPAPAISAAFSFLVIHASWCREARKLGAPD